MSAAWKAEREAYHRHKAKHAGSKQEGPYDLPHNVACGQGGVGEGLQTHSPIRQRLPCPRVVLSSDLSFCGHLERQVEEGQTVLVLTLEKLGLQSTHRTQLAPKKTSHLHGYTACPWLTCEMLSA